ncbi:hypothetical protein C8F01DRAFT_1148156 [Mycena amicta]|nr:hypothetical protein C8F01DRAFT_1148156 [Mycena amicta]
MVKIFFCGSYAVRPWPSRLWERLGADSMAETRSRNGLGLRMTAFCVRALAFAGVLSPLAIDDASTAVKAPSIGVLPTTTGGTLGSGNEKAGPSMLLSKLCHLEKVDSEWWLVGRRTRRVTTDEVTVFYSPSRVQAPEQWGVGVQSKNGDSQTAFNMSLRPQNSMAIRDSGRSRMGPPLARCLSPGT